MSNATGLNCIKRGLLLFWGAWFTLAFLTNTFDFLAALNLLSPEWRFRSGNYALIQSVINIYHLSMGWATFLFLGDIILQITIALLFYYAVYAFHASKHVWSWINRAFGISIGLWLLFVLTDEIFIAYNFEGTHIGLFVAELLSLMAVHLLPSSAK